MTRLKDCKVIRSVIAMFFLDFTCITKCLVSKRKSKAIILKS